MATTVTKKLAVATEDLRDPRVYELGYHLVPQIKEEDLDSEIDALRAVITAEGGLPISEARATLIDLAYSITKVVNNERKSYDKGYFGWIKFDVSPEKLATIKDALDSSEKLIRFILVSTVREDTMTGGKVMSKISSRKPEGGDIKSKPAEKPAVKKEEKPAEPIDEKKLDEQIDELVVPE